MLWCTLGLVKLGVQCLFETMANHFMCDRLGCLKGTPLENMQQAPNNQDDMSGILVSENVIGVVHEHFITFHLDTDIDNTDNSFVNVNLVKEESLPGQSPRKSYSKAKRSVAKTENDAKIKLNLYDP